MDLGREEMTPPDRGGLARYGFDADVAVREPFEQPRDDRAVHRIGLNGALAIGAKDVIDTLGGANDGQTPCLAFAAMPFFVSSPSFSTWFFAMRTAPGVPMV